MRTYGRTTSEIGVKTWIEVDTDANGLNDAVYLTTLTQVLQLSPGESPFYANYGVPYLQSVQMQVPPDLYLARTQQQFAQYFATIAVTRTTLIPAPVYKINVTTTSGVKISMPVPT